MITLHRDLSVTEIPLLLLFPGVASERVHEAERPQILTQDDALLHGEDAADRRKTRNKETSSNVSL